MDIKKVFEDFYYVELEYNGKYKYIITKITDESKFIDRLVNQTITPARISKLMTKYNTTDLTKLKQELLQNQKEHMRVGSFYLSNNVNNYRRLILSIRKAKINKLLNGLD